MIFSLGYVMILAPFTSLCQTFNKSIIKKLKLQPTTTNERKKECVIFIIIKTKIYTWKKKKCNFNSGIHSLITKKQKKKKMIEI